MYWQRCIQAFPLVCELHCIDQELLKRATPLNTENKLWCIGSCPVICKLNARTLA